MQREIPAHARCAAGAPVRIHVLGRFAIEVNGEPLRFSRRAPQKPLELVKALVALGGESVSAETLGDALWPEAEGDQASHALHTTVGRLRQLIGAEALTIQGRRLTLEPARCWVDAFACARHLAEAQRLLHAARLDAANAELEAALGLYRGPLLEGEFTPAPVLSARERLHDLLLRVVQQTGSALLDERRHEAAMALFRRALERDDEAEPLYQGLMRACLAEGRTAEGLAAYQRCRQVLGTSLSTEPSAETEQLQQALAGYRADTKGAGTPDTLPVPPGSGAPARAASPARSRRRVLAVVAGVALVATIAAAGATRLVWRAGGSPASHAGPAAGTALAPAGAFSIAVLAFENLSGDPAQDYFSDGIADSIITALVRIPQLRVVARNSSFAYKGRNVDVRRIGQDLGAGHVLEGSVLRDGAHLRIMAQLIDTRTGDHVWAASYDRELRDVLAVMDDITRHVFTELGVRLVYGEPMRHFVAETHSAAAYDKFLQAAYQFSLFKKASNASAIQLATQAVELDPRFASAMALLGWAHLNDARIGWGSDPAASFRQAAAWARRSLATDVDCVMCMGLMGRILTHQGRHTEAIALHERALNIEPGNAILLQEYAQALVYAGDPQRATAAAQEALHLMPWPSLAALATAGEAYFVAGRYEEARPYYEQMLARTKGRGFQGLNARSRLIAIHMAAHREGEARAQAAKFREQFPQITVRWYDKGVRKWPFRDQSWIAPFMAYLRQAGLPE